MATFSDLVLAAQPALIPEGLQESVQDGATWEFSFACLGEDGSPVDMSAITGTVTLKNGTETVPVDWTFSGSDGVLTLKAEPPAGIAAGATQDGLKLSWGCTLTDGTDTIQAWSGWNSLLVVIPALP